MALTDEELRDAASHRGLKLVKSRRRKAGVGDYGKFGLADAAGNPLFGVGDDGLTASAEDIAEYLRKSEVSTWTESARITPEATKRARTSEVSDTKAEKPPSAIRPRPRRSVTAFSTSRRVESAPELARQPAAPTAGGQAPRQRSGSERVADRAGSAPKAGTRPRPKRATERETAAAAELVVRPARPSDARALRRLLATVDGVVSVAALKRAISRGATHSEPVLVAEKEGLIGCLAWHIIPTLLADDTARITIIFVAENARRSGVGRALYEAALAKFRHRKAVCVEVMSAIEVRNANGFFRAMGMKQASYRFAADV